MRYRVNLGDVALVSPVPSPCIDVCRMDESTGWCRGCQRTIDEIAAWSSLSEDGRREVWVRLLCRRGQQLQQATAVPCPPAGCAGCHGRCARD